MRFLSALLCALAAIAVAQPAFAKSRIKDIVEIEGMRDNILVGQGLVTGLNGTGDNLRNCPQTRQMQEAMLERQGTNVRGGTLNTKNVAFVNVTAKLPAFSAPGATIDVTVSAACDAKSLLGGILVVTPLTAADGRTYAAAQGTVQTGAIAASGASGTSVTKGVPTTGRIASGARIDLDAGFSMNAMSRVRLTLRNPDFTTSRRIADAINGRYPGSAISDNPGAVSIRPTGGMDMTAFITSIEMLEIEPDTPARVMIDEVSGTIVMTDAVRLSKVSIQQGNLTITIQETPVASQPNALSRGGQTVVTPQTQVNVEEQRGTQFVSLPSDPSFQSLINGLNKLGVSPRDMILILQNLKSSGALQAEVVVQ